MRASKNQTKIRPPLPVQLLFALSIVGLIVALASIGAAYAEYLVSEETLYSLFESSFYGRLYFVDSTVTVALIAGSILAYFVRDGKKWAFTSYATVTALVFLSALFTKLKSLTVDTYIFDVTSWNSEWFIGAYGLIGAVLIVVWKKNRTYFD